MSDLRTHINKFLIKIMGIMAPVIFLLTTLPLSTLPLHGQEIEIPETPAEVELDFLKKK